MMYLIDKPLYAIELPDGSLAEDYWAKDYPAWVTFSLIHAEKEVTLRGEGKIVIYSDYIKEKSDEINTQEPSRSC